MQGATGEVSGNNFLGRTTIDNCQLGTMQLGSLTVSVLDAFPQFLKSNGITGILGLDVLKQYDKVSFIDLDKKDGLVLFGGLPASVTTSFKMTTSGGLFFTDGMIVGIPALFVFDTGARFTTISSDFIKENKINLKNKSTRNSSGIDGVTKKVEAGLIEEISFDGKKIKDIEVSIADVSALTALGQGHATLLGMSFFNKFKSVYFHFEKSEWGF